MVVVQNIQDSWNVNAEDFTEMLDKSLPKASKLLASKNSLQAKMFSLFNLY